jgi:hypothetical protein
MRFLGHGLESSGMTGQTGSGSGHRHTGSRQGPETASDAQLDVGQRPSGDIVQGRNHVTVDRVRGRRGARRGLASCARRVSFIDGVGMYYRVVGPSFFQPSKFGPDFV